MLKYFNTINNKIIEQYLNKTTMEIKKIVFYFLLSVIIVAQPISGRPQHQILVQDQELISLQSDNLAGQSSIDTEKPEQRLSQIKQQNRPTASENPFSRSRNINSKNKRPPQINDNWNRIGEEGQQQNGKIYRITEHGDKGDERFPKNKHQQIQRKNHRSQDHNNKVTSLKSLFTSDIAIFLTVGILLFIIVRLCIKKKKNGKKTALRKKNHRMREETGPHFQQRVQNVSFDYQIRNCSSVDDQICYHESEIIKLKNQENIPVGRPIYIHHQANIQFSQ